MAIKTLNTVFFCALLCGICSAGTMITVPELPSVKIKIDGKKEPGEWSPASLLAPMLSGQNNAIFSPEGSVYFLADKENIYLAIQTKFQIGTDVAGEQALKTVAEQHDSEVYRDDSVEIIVSEKANSPKFHQIVINSKGIIYDAEHSTGGRNAQWNLDGIATASSVDGTSWFLEVKLPRKALGIDNRRSILLNICRNWARVKADSTLNGGGYFDRNNMVRLSLVKKASPIRIYPPRHDKDKMAFKSQANGIWELEFMSATGNKEQKKIHALRGKSIELNVMDGGLLTSTIRAANGILLFSRSFRIAPQNTDLLPPAEKILKFGEFGQVQLRFYPGLKRMGINAFLQNSDGYVLTVSCGNTVKHFPVCGNKVQAAFPLPEKAGIYSIKLQLENSSKKVVASENIQWQRCEWEWENKKLGLADKPIPPYQHLTVDGKYIAALTQRYKSGNLGLWDSLIVDSCELLSAPITLTAVQNGKKIFFNGNVSGYRSAGNVDKIAETTSTAGGINLKTVAKYECDGMMYMTLELSSSQNTVLDKLSLRLPLKKEEVFLMHAVGDLIRSNPTGRIPSGKGVVWDSHSVPRRQIDGKTLLKDGFTPYLWLGGIERGICFFADNNRGYALDGKKPMIKLIREKDSVIAEISLIGTKVEIGPKKRILSFGLQGTPVKPRLPFTENLSAQNKKRIRGANMLLMWVLPTSLGFDSMFAFDPGMADKWQLFDWFASAVGKKNGDPAQPSIWRKKLEAHLLNVYSKQKADIRRAAGKYLRNKSPERYQADYMLSRYNEIVRFAKNADRFFVYSDPRLVYLDSAEYKFFRSEWWSPQHVGYIRAARTFPSSSLIDRILYTGYQRLQHGASGIYYDDTFINPVINREADSAGSIDEPGVTRTGILAMRELIKRTAAMSYELKKEPLLMVHHTDGLLIPCFSFANLGLTWEMSAIQEDTQNRFSEDYIFAESNGIHAGLTSFVITGIKHYPSIRKDFSRWPIELRQKTLSLLAVTLQHRMKTYGQWDIDQDTATTVGKAIYGFMADNPGYKFIPYWSKDKAVVTSDDFKAAVYSGNGKALIIVSSYNSSGKGKIKIDFDKLAIAGNSEIYDLALRRTIKNDTENLDIQRNAFTILFVGPKEEGKNILTPDESMTLCLKEPRVLAKNTTLPTPEYWKAMPGFVGKAPVAEKYNAVKNAAGHWYFSIDNTNGKQPVSMVWITDYPEFKVSSTDEIIIRYTHRNLIDPARNVFTFGGIKNGRNGHLIFPKMNFRSSGNNATLQNYTKDLSSLRRLYVRITAKPGIKAEVTLESVEKRNNGK